MNMRYLFISAFRSMMKMISLARSDYALMALKVVKDAFRNHHGLKFKVPIEVDGKIAQSWGELKG